MKRKADQLKVCSANADTFSLSIGWLDDRDPYNRQSTFHEGILVILAPEAIISLTSTTDLHRPLRSLTQQIKLTIDTQTVRRTNAGIDC
ncbi:hypothetical protein KCP74_02840 [Salmonella enterica subsp. enterica]|nr:hypothetical protein KCP74_02840 [Salmonella enterica subsp. enterica]